MNTIYSVIKWVNKNKMIEVEFFYPTLTIRIALKESENLPEKKLPGIRWKPYEQTYKDRQDNVWSRKSCCGRFIQTLTYAVYDGSI